MQLAELGFAVATEGTAAVIQRAGIPVERCTRSPKDSGPTSWTR
jgi:hypothetical protein